MRTKLFLIPFILVSLVACSNESPSSKEETSLTPSSIETTSEISSSKEKLTIYVRDESYFHPEIFSLISEKSKTDTTISHELEFVHTYKPGSSINPTLEEDNADIILGFGNPNYLEYNNLNPDNFVNESLLDSVNSLIRTTNGILPICFSSDLSFYDEETLNKDDYHTFLDFKDKDILITHPQTLYPYLFNNLLLGAKPIIKDGEEYKINYGDDRYPLLSAINSQFREIDPMIMGGALIAVGGLFGVLDLINLSAIRYNHYRITDDVVIEINDVTIEPVRFFNSQFSMVQSKKSSLDESVMKYIYEQFISEDVQKALFNVEKSMYFPVNKSIYSLEDAIKNIKDFAPKIESNNYLWDLYDVNENLFLAKFSEAIFIYEEDINHPFKDYAAYIIDSINKNEFVLSYGNWVNS